jgi:hypothetical protein
MEKKKIVCLFLFLFLTLVFSSCHSRNISDIKPAMTLPAIIKSPLRMPLSYNYSIVSFFSKSIFSPSDER